MKVMMRSESCTSNNEIMRIQNYALVVDINITLTICFRLLLGTNKLLLGTNYMRLNLAIKQRIKQQMRLNLS